MDIAMGGLGAIGTRVAQVRIGGGIPGPSHFEVSGTVGIVLPGGNMDRTIRNSFV